MIMLRLIWQLHERAQNNSFKYMNLMGILPDLFICVCGHIIIFRVYVMN